jgi:hypothetical protein
MQQQMQHYIKEDQVIINIIRQKKILSETGSIATSRLASRNTERSYQ